MSVNAFCKNKILAKISELTVYLIVYSFMNVNASAYNTDEIILVVIPYTVYKKNFYICCCLKDTLNGCLSFLQRFQYVYFSFLAAGNHFWSF